MMWNADGMISRSILGGLVGEALMCFVLCLMPEQVGREFLAGFIINVSFQMIHENRDGILIRILRLGSFSFNTHAGARRCASRHEAASTNVKIAHGPRCLFHTLPEQKWWKRLQRCVALAEESWKKPALQRGTKCYMHGYREKEKKGVGRESAASRAVSGMLKEDKVAARRRSPSPPAPIAGFISWAQQERRLGFVPQKPVSLTGFTACCYMPLPTCATVCESFLSHTLSVCVSSHTVSLTPLFSRFYSLYIFFDSDSREWRKERQGWVFSDAVLFESRLKFGSWGFLSFVVYWFIRCQGLLEILEELVLFVQISCKLSLITALAVLILHQYLTFGLLNWPFLKPLLLWQVSTTRPSFWIQTLKPCMGL